MSFAPCCLNQKRSNERDKILIQTIKKKPLGILMRKGFFTLLKFGKMLWQNSKPSGTFFLNQDLILRSEVTSFQDFHD
ncbi:hypothetical protein BGP_5920 [Beggiatoa sp. PS]|nr:hypothetical protein BGP_5920 [Beggiatoa sp. PS]